MHKKEMAKRYSLKFNYLDSLLKPTKTSLALEKHQPARTLASRLSPRRRRAKHARSKRALQPSA